MASSSDDSLLPRARRGASAVRAHRARLRPRPVADGMRRTENRRSSYDSSDTNAEISGCIRYVFLEEQTSPRGHGVLTIEEVFDRGDASAGRMRARGGLAELLRIADEHEVRVGRANRDDVGERHLSRLVDEEVVERLLHPQDERTATRCRPRAAPRRPRAQTQRFESLPAVTSGWAPPPPSMRVHRRDDDDLSRRRPHIAASRRFVMTAWLLAVMPTRFPATIGVDDGVRRT